MKKILWFETRYAQPVFSLVPGPGYLSHNENMAMQYTEIFKIVKNKNFQWKFLDIFLFFAQNIDCGYTLEPPRTHNLYFGAKIRKIGIPLHTPILLHKSGV